MHSKYNCRQEGSNLRESVQQTTKPTIEEHSKMIKVFIFACFLALAAGHDVYYAAPGAYAAPAAYIAPRAGPLFARSAAVRPFVYSHVHAPATAVETYNSVHTPDSFQQQYRTHYNPASYGIVY